MKSLLILNPASGQGKAERAKRNLLDLLDSSPHVDVKITTGPNDATDFAKQAVIDGYNRVIVAGGDGTINQAINGIAQSKIPLGIIPLGTSNVLAHDIGLDSHKIYEALAVILAGKTREIDLCRAGSKYFCLMAGFGLDADVINSVSPKSKDIIGQVAFARPALETIIKCNPSKFTFIFDNEAEYTTDAFGVIVANCGSYANNLKIAPHAVWDDGLLDIIVFEDAWDTKLKLIGHTLEAVFQQRITDLGATYFKVRKVRIDAEPSVKMHLDGEVSGESGVDIEVLHKALTLIVP